MHPPKIELFDVAAMTNTDPKGFIRSVDEYRVTETGLYMARPVDGHHRLAYFQSLLLPGLGLRVSRWHALPGVDLGHDFYLDIVDVEPGPVWRTTDLYLDIVVTTGAGQELLDVDELLSALLAGLVDQVTAERALDVAAKTTDGIAAAGYQVGEWLSRHDVRLFDT